MGPFAFLWKNVFIRTLALMLIAATIAFGTCQYGVLVTEDLKEELLVEKIEHKSAVKAVEDIQAENEISEAVIVTVLDKKDEVEVKFDKIDDTTKVDILVIKTKMEATNETETTIHRAISERVIVGMWDTYCVAVPDEGGCA